MPRQIRSISSINRSQSSLKSPSITSPPTYSSLRNKVTMPLVKPKEGEAYVSPYAEFFTNIDAGRSSLGTTNELEERASKLEEQRLKCGILESELRFETRSYGRLVLPPYVAAGEHKVTVKVALKAIPFTNEREVDIFLETVGSRFNKKKGVLQLSSEKFASRIENKRYLVDMIERLVFSAKELAIEFAAEDGDKGAAAI